MCKQESDSFAAKEGFLETLFRINAMERSAWLKGAATRFTERLGLPDQTLVESGFSVVLQRVAQEWDVFSSSLLNDFPSLRLTASLLEEERRTIIQDRGQLMRWARKEVTNLLLSTNKHISLALTLCYPLDSLSFPGAMAVCDSYEQFLVFAKKYFLDSLTKLVNGVDSESSEQILSEVYQNSSSPVYCLLQATMLREEVRQSNGSLISLSAAEFSRRAVVDEFKLKDSQYISTKIDNSIYAEPLISRSLLDSVSLLANVERSRRYFEYFSEFLRAHFGVESSSFTRDADLYLAPQFASAPGDVESLEIDPSVSPLIDYWRGQEDFIDLISLSDKNYLSSLHSLSDWLHQARESFSSAGYSSSTLSLSNQAVCRLQLEYVAALEKPSLEWPTLVEQQIQKEIEFIIDKAQPTSLLKSLFSKNIAFREGGVDISVFADELIEFYSLLFDRCALGGAAIDDKEALLFEIFWVTVFSFLEPEVSLGENESIEQLAKSLAFQTAVAKAVLRSNSRMSLYILMRKPELLFLKENLGDIIGMDADINARSLYFRYFLMAVRGFCLSTKSPAYKTLAAAVRFSRSPYQAFYRAKHYSVSSDVDAIFDLDTEQKAFFSLEMRRMLLAAWIEQKNIAFHGSEFQDSWFAAHLLAHIQRHSTKSFEAIVSELLNSTTEDFVSLILQIEALGIKEELSPQDFVDKRIEASRLLENGLSLAEALS